MKEEIEEKIKRLLEEEIPFSKEYQVVYLFVQLRKLIDKTSKNKDHQYIRFVANWIVHTKLEREGTLALLYDDFEKIAEDLESQNGKTILQLLVEGETNSFATFVSFNKLRQELINFFSSRGIPNDLLEEDTNWCALRNLLFRILADQPLDFNKKPIKGIASIHFDKVSADIFGCILVVDFIKEQRTSYSKKFIFGDPSNPNFIIS